MTIQLYANYGVLAHEKETVYTIHCDHLQATCYEVVDIELPESVKPCKAPNGLGIDTIWVTLDGCKYPLDDVLESLNDRPALAWHDGHREHVIKL